MNDFPVIPATPLSINRRKLVYGVGINDAEYMTTPRIKGKQVRCPYYQAWKNMLMRCYCEKYQARYPKYKQCSVSSDWLRFSVFRAWMKKQDWQGKHLDKDILSGNQKIYSHESCVFVDSSINTFFVSRDTDRHSRGIVFDKSRNCYKVQLSENGKPKHIGRFKCAKQAQEEWKKAKGILAKKMAKEQSDPRIRQALMDYSERI
jgi:hypothetical protein